MADSIPLEELQRAFSRLSLKVSEIVRDSLTQLGKEAVEKAQAKLGNYQPQVGPYPAWGPLAPTTKQSRASKGFSPDEPLLASGKLKESISHFVGLNSLIMGTNDEKAATQEFGRDHVPPRPFLGPALFELVEPFNKHLAEQIKDAFEREAAKSMV